MREMVLPGGNCIKKWSLESPTKSTELKKMTLRQEGLVLSMELWAWLKQLLLKFPVSNTLRIRLGELKDEQSYVTYPGQATDGDKHHPEQVTAGKTPTSREYDFLTIATQRLGLTCNEGDFSHDHFSQQEASDVIFPWSCTFSNSDREHFVEVLWSCLQSWRQLRYLTACTSHPPTYLSLIKPFSRPTLPLCIFK